MNSKKLLIALLIVIGIGAVVLLTSKAPDATAPENTDSTNQGNQQQTPATPEVKEFSMTAYYDPALKKPVFSLPEMNVKKGEKVRVKITNTLGVHDYVIDEFAVAKELPLNEEVVVEFTADKAGEFTYYCSKPGHRAAGQFGTLKVTE